MFHSSLLRSRSQHWDEVHRDTVIRVADIRQYTDDNLCNPYSVESGTMEPNTNHHRTKRNSIEKRQENPTIVLTISGLMYVSR